MSAVTPDWREDVIDRLARIETRLDLLPEVHQRIAVLEAFKSRVGGLAIAVAALVSFATTSLAAMIPKWSGHS